MQSYEGAKNCLKKLAESLPDAVVVESIIDEEEFKRAEIAALRLLSYVFSYVNKLFQKPKKSAKDASVIHEIKNFSFALNYSNSVIKFETRSTNFHWQANLAQEIRITAKLRSESQLRFSLKRLAASTDNQISSRSKTLHDNLWLVKPFIGAGVLQALMDDYKLAPMKPVANSDLPTLYALRANDEKAVTELIAKTNLCSFVRKEPSLRSIEFGHTDWRTHSRDQIIEIFDYFDENNDYPCAKSLRLMQMLLDYVG